MTEAEDRAIPPTPSSADARLTANVDIALSDPAADGWLPAVAFVRGSDLLYRLIVDEQRPDKKASDSVRLSRRASSVLPDHEGRVAKLVNAAEFRSKSAENLLLADSDWQVGAAGSSLLRRPTRFRDNEKRPILPAAPLPDESLTLINVDGGSVTDGEEPLSLRISGLAGPTPFFSVRFSSQETLEEWRAALSVQNFTSAPLLSPPAPADEPLPTTVVLETPPPPQSAEPVPAADESLVDEAVEETVVSPSIDAAPVEPLEEGGTVEQDAIADQEDEVAAHEEADEDSGLAATHDNDVIEAAEPDTAHHDDTVDAAEPETAHHDDIVDAESEAVVEHDEGVVADAPTVEDDALPAEVTVADSIDTAENPAESAAVTTDEVDDAAAGATVGDSLSTAAEGAEVEQATRSDPLSVDVPDIAVDADHAVATPRSTAGSSLSGDAADAASSPKSTAGFKSMTLPSRSYSSHSSLAEGGESVGRSSHCIPHRFSTENTLLRLVKCAVCRHTIRERKGVRCQECNQYYHLACSEKEAPNCGLASINKALAKLQGSGQSPISSTVRTKKIGGDIFGISLEEVMAGDDGVPPIVGICIGAIERRGGLNSEGIYRISGVKSDLEKLRIHFAFGRPNLDDDVQWPDINVIAGVFKAWLRELTPPLLTYDLFYRITDLSDPANAYAVDKEKLAVLLEELPAGHHSVLRYLMAHLRRVADNTAVNKMMPANLATVFGPNLLRSRDQSMDRIQQQIAVVEEMIASYHFLFPSSD